MWERMQRILVSHFAGGAEAPLHAGEEHALLDILDILDMPMLVPHGWFLAGKSRRTEIVKRVFAEEWKMSAVLLSIYCPSNLHMRTVHAHRYE